LVACNFKSIAFIGKNFSFTKLLISQAITEMSVYIGAKKDEIVMYPSLNVLKYTANRMSPLMFSVAFLILPSNQFEDDDRYKSYRN
tara:strand:+ start:396 stop:653 length:258 start_codon:yes stop_codon:yes gene_type:complete